MPEPICAIATPNGRGAISIIRTSGSGALEKLWQIFHPINKSIQCLRDYHRQAVYGKIFRKEEIEKTIDDVIVIPYVGPSSYTGEDSAEIQCHGNPIIVESIIEELYHIGFTMARPGEFTKRAFLSGKMNIDEADAVSDIIESKSHGELQNAISKKNGSFRKKMLQLRSDVMNFYGEWTVELDFLEEDIQFSDKEAKMKTIKGLIQEIKKIRNISEKTELYRKGLAITIYGPPNTGKSSLLNFLSGKDKAIVSPIPGTTRDAIESNIEITGIPVTISDTAGIHENTDNSIEQEGMKIAMEKVYDADIHYLMFDASISSEESLSAASMFRKIISDGNKKSFIIINKWDIVDKTWEKSYESSAFWQRLTENEVDLASVIPISVKTGYNLDKLIHSTEEHIKTVTSHEEGILLSAWQKDIISKCEKQMQNTEYLIQNNENPEIIAASVNIIQDYIAELTGYIATEDVLGRIFSRFCIGK